MSIKGHHIGIVAVLLVVAFFALPIGGMTGYARVKAAL